MADIFAPSPRVEKLKKTLSDFVEFDCIPAEAVFHKQIAPPGSAERWKTFPAVIETLKAKAKALGLWNLWMPNYYPEGPGLTNLEYASLCEIMGRCHIAAEATNCSAPDTGNMEVLAKYGNAEQKAKWLVPLMEGRIRSAFAMTEPAVASSDATNIETSIVRDGDSYVVNGRKWWISGAGDPRCALFLVMGKSDPSNTNKHRQQSVIIVPAGTPGITIIRPMLVFGYDDAPHGHMEMVFKDVRVPASNMILGEGRGFEIIQGRLGPGRIHHCMRAIGAAERALEFQLLRLTDPSRKTFGKLLGQHGSAADGVAQSRMEIDQARLLVLRAARSMDVRGPKDAMNEIAMAKVVVPSMCIRVIDRAIQVHGGGGVCQDFPLANMYAMNRTLKIADGPDEVHTMQIGKTELRRARALHDHFAKQDALTKAAVAKL
ncbi:acyl-CoA dehydrogenase/oxidase [Blyttiomyces helicus]|uniref:Acyl-CoA dehydrogenase/oxidase n=1 Tax=Blyttiomyces helicus TaxID=388810 RepID=A0A4P9W6P5_9FUNG|nr:acyl-CoA dehydrogenase/oxidase [Blyttiomyces helicus]|eukprot:RKO88004.1 acyl-CoA dehydrogenase/oxidase [Blyttiomyces helicus]